MTTQLATDDFYSESVITHFFFRPLFSNEDTMAVKFAKRLWQFLIELRSMTQALHIFL